MSQKPAPAPGGSPAPDPAATSPDPPAPNPDPPAAPNAPPGTPASAAPTVIVVELDEDDREHGVTVSEQGDRVAVPQASFRKLKDKAADRARAKAQAEFAERAKTLGFASVDDMFAALERKEINPVTTPNQNPPGTNPLITPPAGAAPAGAPPAAAPPPAQQPPAGQPPAGDPPDGDPENDRRYSAAQRAKLRQAREDMKGKVSAAEQARLAAEEAVKAKDLEMATWRAEQTMREDMIRAGCTEVDFTFAKLREHLAQLTAEAAKSPEAKEKLEKFDLKAWLEERRKAQPFLFSTVVQPANTGNSPAGGDPPGAPDPASAAARAAGGAKKDAKSMTPAEWQAYKKQHGIP